MAYITINENFHRCNTCGPLGLQLALQYNPKTGEHRLIEKNILGIGSAIFYQNGTYYSDAIQDTTLFTDRNPNNLTAEGQALSTRIRTTVHDTFQTLGGQSKGNITNDTTKPQNQTAKPGVINSAVGTSPGIAGAVPILSNPPGQGNIFDLFSGGLKPNPKYTPIKSPATAKQQTLKYPIDMISDRQDTLQITEIIYKPPTEDIFSGGANITEILTKGLTRGSVKKERGAQIILPMPNNAQDSNNVSWGEDNMNSLTTAATGTILNNPGGTAAGLAASNITEFLAKLKNLPGLGNIVGQLPKAALLADLGRRAAGGGAESENMLKAALTSFILQKYGFEVSPESILARGLGVVPNSNMQLLFNNVKLRGFNFSYLMSPRSKDEAKVVNQIIRTFKQGMAAKKRNLQAGGASLFLGTPNVYKLEYKIGNDQIKGMNKFKICALTGFAVNYSPHGKWSAYEGGQPSSVTMTMTFQELEPIFDTDYQNNIPDDYRFDLPKVEADEIGY
jgi:hypothetical protein